MDSWSHVTTTFSFKTISLSQDETPYPLNSHCFLRPLASTTVLSVSTNYLFWISQKSGITKYCDLLCLAPFPLASCLWGPSMLEQGSVLHCFIWLNNTPTVLKFWIRCFSFALCTGLCNHEAGLSWLWWGVGAGHTQWDPCLPLLPPRILHHTAKWSSAGEAWQCRLLV